MRVLAMILACVTVLCAYPFVPFTANAAEEGKTEDPRVYTYEEMYVSDADGDGEDDRVFFWDAFDIKSGAGAVTALQNQLNPSQSVTLDGTAGDGYVASLSKLDFSTYFQAFAKTVPYADASVSVMQDSTLEMVLFQNTATTYTNESFAHNKMNVVPLNEFNLQYYNGGDSSASFIWQSYGQYSKLTSGQGEVAFDVKGTWADRNTAVLGNQRGADHTFTYAIRHDFDVADGAIDGTLTLDFMRDGEVPTNGKHATTYSMLYDARYRGHYSGAETPLAANNAYSFGGLDFGYRAIRIYDVALTEAQMAQNHAADLFKYYGFDLQTFMKASESVRQKTVNALAGYAIGSTDKTAIDKVFSRYLEEEAQAEYNELYASEGLVFSFNGFNLSSSDGKISKISSNDKEITLDGTAGDGYLYSKSILNFTDLLEIKTADDGAMLFPDHTLEIVLKQIDGVTESGVQIRGTLNIPHVSNGQICAANYPDNVNKRPIDASYGFVSESYGILTKPDKTGQLQMPTDVAHNPLKVFGNTQNKTYSVSVRSDYEITDKATSTGSMQVSYFRDGAQATLYDASYDAHYIGNFAVESPTKASASNLTLKFGGLGFGYQSIRLYNRALTEEEIMQNHAADLFAYYQVKLDGYRSLNDTQRKRALDALTAYKIGETSKEAIEELFVSVTLPTLEDLYGGLYVEEGLIFRWDGFELQATGQPLTELTNFLPDGPSLTRRTTNRELPGIGADGLGKTLSDLYAYNSSALFTASSMLMFTDLLPYTEEDGTLRPSDMTLEISSCYPSSYKISPDAPEKKNTTGYDGSYLYVGPLGSIRFGKVNPNQTKGEGAMVDAITNPFKSWSGDFAPFDKGGISFMGNYPDKVFYNALNFDYDESAASSRIPYTFSIGRDGSYVYTGSTKNYSPTADYSAYDGSATNMQLTYGSTIGTLYYSIRLYNRTLTELEMQQNHTADLFKYYRVDMDLFNKLDWKAAERLYEELATYQIGETSKEEIEAIIENFILTGGALGVIDVNDYLRFVGVQARIEDYAALRVRYAFSLEKFELLNDLGIDFTFGMLYGKTSDFENPEALTLNYNASINEFIPSKASGVNRTVYYCGEWTDQVDYLVTKDGAIDFGITLPRIETADPDFSKKASDEYYVRAYMAASIDGTPFVVYLDLDTEEFGKALSIANTNEFFLCNGYASSKILALTSSENVRVAAEKTESLYLSSFEKQLKLQQLIETVRGANQGANLSGGNYTKVENSASVDMDLASAMQMGALSATSRTELSIYIKLGLTAYEDAKTIFADLQKENGERYDLLLKTLKERGLNDDEAALMAESIAKNMNTLCAKAASALTDAEFVAQSLDGYKTTLESSYAQNKISKVLSPSSSLFIAGTSVARYTIVTNAEALHAAEQLQHFFLINQGAFVGIYRIDNPYIGHFYDLDDDNLIYVGVTNTHLKDQLFSCYIQGTKLYFEGNTENTLQAAVTAFTRTYCAGTGRIRLDESSLGNALLLKDYAPMIQTNIPTTYEKITVSSYDVTGVWEAFQQTINNKPEEMTVLDKKNVNDFAYSATFEVIVSPDGNDETGEGTLEKPYATLDRALEAVSYRDGAIIKLRGGTYSLSKTAKISDIHSGTETAPLIITAYENEEVIFTTGKTIDGSLFTKASDADFVTDTDKKRLNTFTAGNADNVYALNLADVGISSLSSFVNNSSQPGIYVGNTAYCIARFPNAGENNEEMRIYDGRIRTSYAAKDIKNCGNVTEGISDLYAQHKTDSTTWEIWLDDGDSNTENDLTYRDRVLGYDLSSDKLWTKASVYEEWDTAVYGLTLKTESGKNYLKSDTASRYGAKHSSDNGLFFFNMLEDLDCVGEYLINPTTCILYIYAPDGLAGQEITVSISSSVAMSFTETQNVLLNGITFERSSGTAVYVNESENVLIQNCTFRNLSAGGVSLATSFNSGVTYSQFYDCKQLSLSSSLTSQFVPNRCFVQNNVFANANETDSLAIRISGVANVISHNYFYETTISFDYNLETVIEYNEFVRGSQLVRDNGPIYSSYRARGMIIRYNYLHDLNYSGYGIYVDDMGSEHYIYGNVVHYAKDGVGGRCVHLHNGNMNVVMNNICLTPNGSAIANQLNYYPKTIDGKKTGYGNLAYRWESIARDRLVGYYNVYLKEAIEDRYPMFVWFSDIAIRSVKAMDTNPTWEPLNKWSVRDKDEIFTRTPVFNIYKNNVFYDCKAGFAVPNIGLDTCIMEGNKEYALGTDIGFVDYENGNYQIKEDSILFDEIDGFFAPPFEKMGLTEK